MTQEEPKEDKLFESVEQLSKIAQDLIRRKTELSQPEQDSVAMSDYMALMEKYAFLKAQRTWVGLTDEEIIDVIHPLVMADMPDQATDYEIARAIEAKLKEKNT